MNCNSWDTLATEVVIFRVVRLEPGVNPYRFAQRNTRRYAEIIGEAQYRCQ